MKSRPIERLMLLGNDRRLTDALVIIAVALLQQQ